MKEEQHQLYVSRDYGDDVEAHASIYIGTFQQCVALNHLLTRLYCDLFEVRSLYYSADSSDVQYDALLTALLEEQRKHVPQYVVEYADETCEVFEAEDALKDELFENFANIREVYSMWSWRKGRSHYPASSEDEEFFF